MADQIPILDSHIHLYPAAEVDTLAWCTPDHPLSGQHSVDEFAAATALPASLEGFIFLETDRKHDLAAGVADSTGYAQPLAEVAFLSRVARGAPRDGEGHSAAQAHLCRAIVPWAPMPSGAEEVQRYVGLVKEAAGEEVVQKKIRGFRYLLQGKGPGVGTQDGFVDSLRWLGKEGYSFDVGVDCHRDGVNVLGEVMEMIGRAHEGVVRKEKVVFVLNHLLKPDITLTGDLESHAEFTAWREGIYQLSRCDRTYMKLSGCFMEIDPEFESAPPPKPPNPDAKPFHFPDQFTDQEEDSLRKLFNVLQPYLAVILAAFTPYRIMFASDWPVCTVGGVKSDAWRKWVWIVRRMCDLGGLSVEEQVMIWSGTAIGAYSIEEMM